MDVGGSDAATKKKKKKERQDRTLPVLGTKLEEFTYVKPSGQPMEPAKLAAGYGIQLGCIVRESMSINQKNIRAKGIRGCASSSLGSFTTGTSSQSHSITRSSKGTRSIS
jgi:hypothetical protein